jgi:hypothetical protein
METITRPSRNRRSNRQILDLLKVFNEQKIKVVDFCKINKIDKGTFYKWQSRYRSNSGKKPEKPGFADVRIINVPSATLFAEVNGIKIFQPVLACYLKELLQ